MKFNYLIIVASLMIASCHSTKIAERENKEKRMEGAEEDLRLREEWDRERLADPRTGEIPKMMREKELSFVSTIPGNQTNTRSAMSQINYDFRGPFNLGGRTRAFAIDVTNDNILLAGSASGGLWRSTDAGATWTRVTTLGSYQGVNAIAQDKRPGHTNTWYYLTGEAYGTSASGGSAFYLGNGMYKSVDGGLTWTSLASTSSGTPQTFDNIWDVTWAVATDNGNLSQDVLYAAVYDGIYRSVNGGTSWSLVKGGGGASSLQAYFTDVAVSPTSVVYATISSDGAVAQKGIWRSVGGTSWTNITPSNFPVNYDRIVAGIDPNNENIVYFFGPTPGYGKVSTDFLGDTLYNSLWKYEYISGTGAGAGGVWTDLSQNLPGNIGVFNGMNTQGGYDVVVKVMPGNSNAVFLGGTNIYRSTTAFSDSLHNDVIGGYEPGAALPFVNEYEGHHPDQHVMEFIPSNPAKMYSANDGGIARTDDCLASNVVWNDLNNGYITSQFYTVTMDMNATDDVLMGGLQDNGTYRTTNAISTDPWTHPFDGDGSYCAIGNGTEYYFSKQQGRIYKTHLDAQGNVTDYRRMDPIGASNYRFIAPFVLDPNNNDLMYLCAGESIWRNDDLSAIQLTNQFDTISTNWVQFPDTLAITDEVITALAISKTPANRLYYGTNKRNIYRIDNANVGIPTRQTITSTLFTATGYISCIAVNPANADEIMVVFSNYNIYSLFHSNDGGLNWTKVGGNLEATTGGTGNGPSLRWASILPLANGDKIYFVGGSTGLYATATLNGLTTVWIQQGANTIGKSIVDMMAVRPSDGLIAVATHGNGMYSAHITSVNDITSLDEYSKMDFQIYPNPASKFINVKLPVADFDGLVSRYEIVNEIGQSIVNTDNSRFNQEFKIDVSEYKSGVYYLKLISNQGIILSTKSFVVR
ncbi:MAG: T9SS type A sorting domain-containing protein [Bacteroidota bacterium]